MMLIPGLPWPWVATLKSNWSNQTIDSALEKFPENKNTNTVKNILFFNIILKNLIN